MSRVVPEGYASANWTARKQTPSRAGISAEPGDSTQPYRVYDNMAILVAGWYSRSSCVAFIGFVLFGISMLIYCVWYPNTPKHQLSASAIILILFCVSAGIAAYGDVAYHSKLRQLYTDSK